MDTIPVSVLIFNILTLGDILKISTKGHVSLIGGRTWDWAPESFHNDPYVYFFYKREFSLSRIIGYQWIMVEKRG